MAAVDGVLRRRSGREGITVKSRAGARPENSDQEVLAGLVERVTFHSPESGFCVLRTKARGHRDLVTVVGHAAMVAAGEWITASGEWVNDRTHGQQFKARFLRCSAPRPRREWRNTSPPAASGGSAGVCPQAGPGIRRTRV